MSFEADAKLPLGSMQKKLSDLHRCLLHLHKILMEDERKSYELKHGPVKTSGQLLNLVMYDPFFDWLHKISEAVVRIDEIMEDEKSSYEDASDLLASVRELFQPGETDTPFMSKYKSALRRAPAAVNAHAELQKLLLPDA